MILASQLVQHVRWRFDAASTTRVTDAAILEAVNEGLDELAEATGFYERWVNVPIRNGRTYYDLRGWLPETALGVTSVWNTISTRWMHPASEEELSYARWKRVTGDPRNYWIRGLYWMGVFPKGTADSGFFRVYFKALVPHLVQDNDAIPELPDDFNNTVEDYALYELFAREGETSKALALWNSYQDGENKAKKLVKDRITAARSGRLGRR